jgi:hypothetical protein
LYPQCGVAARVVQNDGWPISVPPNDEVVFVNHLTGHFSGALAYQFLHTSYDRGDGREPSDVTMREYEQATGWKNNSKKAGPDLEKRSRELAERAKSE